MVETSARRRRWPKATRSAVPRARPSSGSPRSFTAGRTGLIEGDQIAARVHARAEIHQRARTASYQPAPIRARRCRRRSCVLRLRERCGAPRRTQRAACGRACRSRGSTIDRRVVGCRLRAGSRDHWATATSPAAGSSLQLLAPGSRTSPFMTYGMRSRGRMIARGIEPVTLAKLMGHQDIRETLNTLWVPETPPRSSGVVGVRAPRSAR